MKYTLYPLYGLADQIDDQPFDLSTLPLQITDSVRLEPVADRFRPGAFDLWKKMIGENAFEKTERIRFALVHRYDSSAVNPQKAEEKSKEIVNQLAACLRLIRPMRESVLSVHGDIRDDDGLFEVGGFDLFPGGHVEVPEVQRLFHLRHKDVEDLVRLAPLFLEAMEGEIWKFRMAVQFHELGHFQSVAWKGRFLLWCSAIESIYTTVHREHQGSRVAKARIKWFLGANTNIYQNGDLSSLLTDPQINVADVLDDLYEMRNFIAHGDKLPDLYFQEQMRTGFNGPVKKVEVLLEAASSIIRMSLKKILRDNLVPNFAGAVEAQAFFAAQRLTKSDLQRVN